MRCKVVKTVQDTVAYCMAGKFHEVLVFIISWLIRAVMKISTLEK